MTTRFNPSQITATTHQIRERFGDPALFGLNAPPSADFLVQAGKLVLAIAGADGQVSPQERQATIESAKFWGATNKQAEEIGSFNPSKVKIESLVTDATRKLAAMLLYDGIRIARIDGFHEKERIATQKAAKALGLDAGIVPAIESLLLVDDALHVTRARLLQLPTDHMGAAPGQAVATGDAGRQIEYGTTGPVPSGLIERISQAILVVAAGDGQLTEAELAWHVGQARTVGAPDEAIEKALKFDPVGERIEDHIDASLRPYARLIVFDAMRCARVDGYHERERALARRAAEKLQLDDGFVVAMENQLQLEDAAREARLALLRPQA